MNTDPSQQDFWTASSLAQVAGVASSYIARLCRQGKITAQKFGPAWMITLEEGQRWLEERAAKLAVGSESTPSEDEDEATEEPLTEA